MYPFTNQDLILEEQQLNESLKPICPCLGITSSLRINRLVEIGAYVDAAGVEVLLPRRYLPTGAAEGQMIDAFVYHDNEGRLIATTLHPLVEVGQVATLTAVNVTRHGAFMQWGIHRDLFVPYAEQSDEIREGYTYLVYAYIDELSGKIVGSTKLSKHLGNVPPLYKPGDKVEIQVYGRNDYGYRVVVDHQHWGMIYYSDISTHLSHGDKSEAYVIRVREDGRLDLSLSAVGYGKIASEAEWLMQLLHKHNGHLPIGDKSSPEKIRSVCKMSKKTFKTAVGMLYKEGRIVIDANFIALKEK
ncbi:CvfB family protein [Porphyromonas crevioricanis]|uniref:S1 motif domain-containing protein n=1 Tax=Porphyromonas crevioricanis JCM 15906 TaxID=1305617 RepID=T1CSA7_9PORP|nr:S1-like domain-containing RNA-binding protein [Porphyromonas crevioricanis]GAD06008.1 hypothetical protein PORCRE_1728 [Porphyromonas crevioricanis JCM 15906]SJZ57328.1 hypothetical protein SAMN02745203_00208 [Porphyromonas crevioricanis]